MEIRFKYSNYDVQEFESLGQKELNSAVELFNNFPWIEETKKLRNVKETISYPTMKLVKSNGEYAEINGFENGDLILFNIHLRFKSVVLWRTLISLRYNSNEVSDFIRDYYSKSTVDVIRQLKTKKVIEGSFIMDLLVYNSGDKDKIVSFDRENKREYVYKFRMSRVISKSLLSIGFILLAIIPPIFILVKTDTDDIGFLFFFLFVGFFGLPGLILANNHTKHSRNQRIYFQKNNNIFVVFEEGVKRVFNKVDIELIEKYTTIANSRAPWNSFEYWKLGFNNGEILFISDVIINEKDFMKHTGIMILDEDKEKQFLPMIKTRI